jgi:hypothetical protein
MVDHTPRADRRVSVRWNQPRQLREIRHRPQRFCLSAAPVTMVESRVGSSFLAGRFWRAQRHRRVTGSTAGGSPSSPRRAHTIRLIIALAAPFMAHWARIGTFVPHQRNPHDGQQQHIDSIRAGRSRQVCSSNVIAAVSFARAASTRGVTNAIPCSSTRISKRASS